MIEYFTHPAALWIWLSALAFGLSHSLLTEPVCRRFSGLSATSYRLSYSLLATALTGLWLWLVHALPDAPLFHVSGIASLPFYALQIIGLGVILLSLRAFDAGIFLGFKPIPESGEGFVENGIYRHMRHPMYSGFMLLLLASPVQSMNSLHLSLAVCAYFLIGSRNEERRMLAIEPTYAAYLRRVPAFVPGASLFRRASSPQ